MSQFREKKSSLLGFQVKCAPKRRRTVLRIGKMPTPIFVKICSKFQKEVDTQRGNSKGPLLSSRCEENWTTSQAINIKAQYFDPAIIIGIHKSSKSFTSQVKFLGARRVYKLPHQRRINIKRHSTKFNRLCDLASENSFTSVQCAPCNNKLADSHSKDTVGKPAKEIVSKFRDVLECVERISSMMNIQSNPDTAPLFIAIHGGTSKGPVNLHRRTVT